MVVGRKLMNTVGFYCFFRVSNHVIYSHFDFLHGVFSVLNWAFEDLYGVSGILGLNAGVHDCDTYGKSCLLFRKLTCKAVWMWF